MLEGSQAGGLRAGRLCGQGVQDSLASVSTVAQLSNVWPYSHAGGARDHATSGLVFQDTHLSLPLRTRMPNSCRVDDIGLLRAGLRGVEAVDPCVGRCHGIK